MESSSQEQEEPKIGQYHIIVNIDKEEYLHPHSFDDGMKLMEFGMSGYGTMTALAVLLSDSPDRGGGDLHSDDREWYGRWAGDRIIIAGDYADGYEGKPNLYDRCKCDGSAFMDISVKVRDMISESGESIRGSK